MVPPCPTGRGNGGSLLILGVSLLPPERAMDDELGAVAVGTTEGAGTVVLGTGGGLVFVCMLRFLEKRLNFSFAGLPTLGTDGP